MDPVIVAEGNSGTLGEARMVLPSSSSAQSALEVIKYETDSAEKSVQHVKVPDLPERRKSNKNVFLKKIGWKRSKKQKAVQTDKVTLYTTGGKGKKNDGKDVSGVHKNGVGTVVPPTDVESSTRKDSKMDNPGTENDKKVKKFWLKRLRRKTEISSKKADKELNQRTTKEIGNIGIGKDVDKGPSASTNGSENVTALKNVETSRNVESSMATCIPIPAVNRKGNKRSLLSKFRLKKRDSYDKADKEMTPRVSSKTGCKGMRSYFMAGPTVSSNKSRKVAATKIEEPESAVATLTSDPTQKQETKKRSWLGRLRVKRKTSSTNSQKDVAPRIASEIGENEMKNDIGACTSSNRCGNVVPKVKVEPPADPLNPALANKQEFEQRQSANRNDCSHGEDAVCLDIMGGRIRRKGRRDMKIDIVAALPQTLKPSSMSVEGNKRALNFAFKEAKSSSDVFGIQQQRDVCELNDNRSGARRVGIAPQIQIILSKLTPAGNCFYINMIAFHDLFTTMLLQPHSSNQGHYRLNEEQSNSDECQLQHIGRATYGLYLWILINRLDSEKELSSREHKFKDQAILPMSQRAVCHYNSDFNKEKDHDANTTTFGIKTFNPTVIKEEQCSKCVIQQHEYPGDLYGFGGCEEKGFSYTTNIIAQLCYLNHDILQLNLKCDNVLFRVMKAEDVDFFMWNAQKREILAPVSQEKHSQNSIIELTSEPSLSSKQDSTSQNDCRGSYPIKSSKWKKVTLPAARANCSISDSSSTVDVLPDERNFSEGTNCIPSKSASTSMMPIEVLHVNSNVEYLESEGSLHVESVNVLERENAEMKSIQDELQIGNKKLMTLLQDMSKSDGANEIYCEEELALHSPLSKNGSKTCVMKENVERETAIASSSKSNREKYGQISEIQSDSETLDTNKGFGNVDRNAVRKKPKMRPDFVELPSDKGVESNIKFEDTVAGAIASDNKLTDTTCAEATVLGIPEEKYPSVFSLIKSEIVSEESLMQVMEDDEEILCKDLSSLNQNLERNISAALTKVKKYYTLFTKENSSLRPLKATLRNQLEILKKNSEYVVELKNIIQDLLQDNGNCELPGELQVQSSGKEKERASENVLPQRKKKPRKRGCKLDRTGDEKFSFSSRSIQSTHVQSKDISAKPSYANIVKKNLRVDCGATRNGQSIGNTQSKDISAKPSYANIVKKNLRVDCGATRNGQSIGNTQSKDISAKPSYANIVKKNLRVDCGATRNGQSIGNTQSKDISAKPSYANIVKKNLRVDCGATRNGQSIGNTQSKDISAKPSYANIVKKNLRVVCGATRNGQSIGNTQSKDISAKPSYADIVKRNLRVDCGVTGDGQSTGNTQNKNMSTNPSCADIAKRNLRVDCGATSKSHTKTMEKTTRKCTHSENCVKVLPLMERGKCEGIKSYHTMIFRSSRKMPLGGSSKKSLN